MFIADAAIDEWSIAGSSVAELSLLPVDPIVVRILWYFAICPHTWQLPPLHPCIDYQIGSLPELGIASLKNSFPISPPVPGAFTAMR
jgi:hypothetical protein